MLVESEYWFKAWPLSLNKEFAAEVLTGIESSAFHGYQADKILKAISSDVSERVFEAVRSEFRACCIAPYQQTPFVVVDLLVCFYSGIFGESGGRDEEIWRAGSHLHSSGLVSFFLAKEKQVYRFTSNSIDLQCSSYSS